MFRRDEHILAQWDDGHWYPARVNAIRGDLHTIVFDDGDVAEYAASRLAPLDWGPGTRVQGEWKGGGQYFAGTIAEREGARVVIEYDDGDVEECGIGRCRSIEPDSVATPGEW